MNMANNIALDNVQKSHCRFCAENKAENELYVLTRNEELNDRIMKIIESLKIDFVDLSNSKLPRCVCRGCYAFLETADDFFTKARNSQPLLSAMYEKENIPEMTVEVKTESFDIETEDLCEDADVERRNNNEVLDDLNVNELQITPQPLVDVFVYSWKSYKWKCLHCSVSFDSMNDLRNHSKFDHKKCFGFKCADCDDGFNTFSTFIEHVRGHREDLRNYCPYCNKRFDDAGQCIAHLTEHGISEATTCPYCGEIFPATDLLDTHKSIYKMVEIPEAVPPAPTKERPPKVEYKIRKGWMRYKWTCQDCFKGFEGVVPLRAHVQKEHKKCFAIKCMDCNRNMRNYAKFVEHVHQHQPSLKEFCQFCNKRIPSEKKLKAHIEEHTSGPQAPCYGCGQIFEDNKILKKHMLEYDAPAPPKALQGRDRSCDQCGKVLATPARLRTHKLTHDPDRPRSFICDVCNKGFQSKENLRCHKRLHGTKRHVCRICQRAFSLQLALLEHLSKHSSFKQFECDHCGKRFWSKNRLRPHLKCHEEVKQFVCKTCGKGFRFNNLLVAHERQHTGTRPHVCALCRRAFTIRPLLNKHMMAVHGTTLVQHEAATRTSGDQGRSK
ncbi:oocyte zinc finger protein XlCOF6-like [Bombyx mandarina]|uniref:Oocyte zinc finger protein XlCOF6-like n=1 Tax=Bombyx mandarina TaxID=7092 RepID=A0A6J2KKK7_BOMMA|nr:oocyte zinc finger protein XlCOF6-like [Bombyx mandarina]